MAESAQDPTSSAAGRGSSGAAIKGDPATTAESPQASDVILEPVEQELPGDEWADKVKTILIGKPRDLGDSNVFQHLSLVAFLAWVGLGADGLSSSCYGPSEAYINLGEHRYLAVFLSLMTVLTVFVISFCYRHIIEQFPTGGGGYLVASKVLGKPVGVVSGSALLVDYILTITVSTAAAGDALFGLLPVEYHGWKIWTEVVAIIALVVLNLRGVKESIIALMPIFIIFLITHLLVIGGVVGLHTAGFAEVAGKVGTEIQRDLADPGFGLFGMLALLLHAYSLGAGTYTGIEAVSNSMPVMREPKVKTAKRTMIYMAVSLAFVAGGLMLGYLLLDIRPEIDRTMNLILTEQLVSEVGFKGTWSGDAFLLVTIISEGALLIVAAQAGFIDGPRVLANMARDSFVPHWFSNLSDRLTTHNGVLLMGVAALAALLYTNGEVSMLVIMYSINVFLTFSLSMVAMCKYWFDRRALNPRWKSQLALFAFGAAMCLSILIVTVVEKFEEGGWRTLAVTGTLVGVCFLIRHEYLNVYSRLEKLDESLVDVAARATPIRDACDPEQPTAAILVGGYGGLGVHTLLNALRLTPGHFKNVIFLSVGVVDSGNFKGVTAVEELKAATSATLEKYVMLARRIGLPSVSYMALGTDVAESLEQLCVAVSKEFPRVVFFAGQLVFQKDKWYQRLLHNETALSLQRRLQWAGLPIVILPTRVR